MIYCWIFNLIYYMSAYYVRFTNIYPNFFSIQSFSSMTLALNVYFINLFHKLLE